eukprot:138568-Chlamydomonas_euryale.AAC.1
MRRYRRGFRDGGKGRGFLPPIDLWELPECLAGPHAGTWCASGWPHAMMRPHMVIMKQGVAG